MTPKQEEASSETIQGHIVANKKTTEIMSPCLETSKMRIVGYEKNTSLEETEEPGKNQASPNIRTFSLGSGSFPTSGDVHFIASPHAKMIRSRCSSHDVTTTTSVASSSSLSSLNGFLNGSPTITHYKEKDDTSKEMNLYHKFNTPEKYQTKAPQQPFDSPKRIYERVSEKLEKVVTRRKVHFVRSGSSYMRSADLGMSDSNPSHSMHNDEDEIVSNYHHPSPNPPPGINLDSKEQWVALDDGAGSHSPVAPLAIQALVDSGYKFATEPHMWAPVKRTDQELRNTSSGWKTSCVWQHEQEGKRAIVPPKGSAEEKEILTWTGSFQHTYYGSDLPAVRAIGVVSMPARSLFDLLVDSSRVKEYNKMSLGREDLLVLQDNMIEDGPFGKSVTKIIQSQNQPPVIRRAVQLTTLMHAKELPTSNGFMVVSRAVTKPDDLGKESGVITSEILLGVTLILKVEGDEDRCLMINVNHVRPTLVPLMVAKRLGLAAASSFINDVRALC
mmetsp:Transcript_25304/g.38966  ORF Transcript_25304/g.38966 Transcript_25304/m.38966 type:complete len:501 (+) Transcript_25304:99-1601(+)